MNYRDPKYNADNTIDCEIEHPDYGWIPFTASPDDVEVHGRELFAQITQAGGIAPYEPPPPPTDEEFATAARAKRNQLLAASDWTQLPDISEEVNLAWQPYRQALRDVPEQPAFPQDIQWPEKP